MRVTKEEQQNVTKILAAILHLGNVGFKKASANSDDVLLENEPGKHYNVWGSVPALPKPPLSKFRLSTFILLVLGKIRRGLP